MTYETSVALLFVVLLYALTCLSLVVKGIRADRRLEQEQSRDALCHTPAAKTTSENSPKPRL